MSRLGQEVGASSVELIIFFPLLLLVVLITVQVALTWYGNEVAIATAREVAREARANSKGGDLSAGLSPRVKASVTSERETFRSDR